MAEGLFCAELEKQGLSSLCSVKSAGLAATVGAPPSDNAVSAAKNTAPIFPRTVPTHFRNMI